MTITVIDAFMVGPHNLFDYNGITLNDRESSVECYWVNDFQGFESPDIRVSSTEDTEQDGSIPNPAFLGERTMTLSGWYRASNYKRLLEMGAALKKAATTLVEVPLVVRTADIQIVIGDPNPTGDGFQFDQQPVEINCRLADKLMIDMKLTEADLGGLPRRPFSVSLIASKPLFLDTTAQTGVIYPVVAEFLGRTYDRDYDLDYTSRMDAFGNPTSGGNSINLTVGGNYTAQPVVKFIGPLTGATLRNETLGLELILKYSLLAGESITVDVASGRITDALGIRRDDYIDTRSDDFLLRGEFVNVVSLLAESFDVAAGSSVQVTWRDTYL